MGWSTSQVASPADAANAGDKAVAGTRGNPHRKRQENFPGATELVRMWSLACLWLSCCADADTNPPGSCRLNRSEAIIIRFTADMTRGAGSIARVAGFVSRLPERERIYYWSHKTHNVKRVLKFTMGPKTEERQRHFHQCRDCRTSIVRFLAGSCLVFFSSNSPPPEKRIGELKICREPLFFRTKRASSLDRGLQMKAASVLI